MKVFNIPFREVLIPLYEGDYKRKILKFSPAGKVPALQHGKTTVWDSLAIAEFLAELFPQKHLWPRDKAARAMARSVAAEMHSGFMPLRKNCPMDVRAYKPQKNFSPDVSTDMERIRTIWESCRRKFGRGGEFLFGKFSIADAMFAPVVWRFNTYGGPLTGSAERYQASMLQLPAMQEWKAAAEKEPWTIVH